MASITSYTTVYLMETLQLIDKLAEDLTLTTKDIEDFPTEQLEHVTRMNSDIAKYNEGIFHLKCSIKRELLKEAEADG